MAYDSTTVTDITAPLASAVISLQVTAGDQVQAGDVIAIVESMKMQTSIEAPASGTIASINARIGDTVQQDHVICTLQVTGDTPAESASEQTITPAATVQTDNPLSQLQTRIEATSDANRTEAVNKRHQKGYRTARENLADLCDPDSFIEYGQLAVAAQRQRTDIETLRSKTAADGIITGLATVNSDLFSDADTSVALVVNDYTVLAGTQGYYHHKKLDRILEVAATQQTPVIMYTEGGGGRPGDTDVQTAICWLNVPSFTTWSRLSGVVPKIAVNNGYCFAGNAALFGCADIRIATRTSWIGMAGPAMIEGGGLGVFKPTEIGPIEVQTENGVVDIVADDEAHATQLAKQALSYFQGLAHRMGLRRPKQSAYPDAGRPTFYLQRATSHRSLGRY